MTETGRTDAKREAQADPFVWEFASPYEREVFRQKHMPDIRADILATVGGLLRNGGLPWGDAYPIGYVTDNGETLCAACAVEWAADVVAATIFEGSCVDYDGPQWCDGATSCGQPDGEAYRFVRCDCDPDGEPGDWCTAHREGRATTRPGRGPSLKGAERDAHFKSSALLVTEAATGEPRPEWNQRERDALAVALGYADADEAHKAPIDELIRRSERHADGLGRMAAEPTDADAEAANERRDELADLGDYGPDDTVTHTSMMRQGWRLLARAPRSTWDGEDVLLHVDPRPGVSKFAIHYAMAESGECYQGEYFECMAGPGHPGARGAESRSWATFEGRRRGLSGDALTEFVNVGGDIS